LANPAFAHAFLNHADPGAGAVLRSPPRKVVLVFSEKLQLASSGVGVTNSAGGRVEAGTVVIDGNSIVAPLRPLPPGRYRVVWHAVSLDNHRTQGAYSFVIKP
jgi:methionine-rich copper-binding protein CopC